MRLLCLPKTTERARKYLGEKNGLGGSGKLAVAWVKRGLASRFAFGGAPPVYMSASYG